jgi:hypothetical protein
MGISTGTSYSREIQAADVFPGLREIFQIPDRELAQMPCIRRHANLTINTSSSQPYAKRRLLGEKNTTMMEDSFYHRVIA